MTFPRDLRLRPGNNSKTRANPCPASLIVSRPARPAPGPDQSLSTITDWAEWRTIRAALEPSR